MQREGARTAATATATAAVAAVVGQLMGAPTALLRPRLAALSAVVGLLGAGATPDRGRSSAYAVRASCSLCRAAGFTW
jgi:hypothetical protein